MPDPALDVRDLSVCFDTRRGTVRAVDGLSFDVNAGETLAIVGESGSGKSVASLAVLGLVPNPGRITGGHVFFDGQDLVVASERERRRVRGRGIAWIPQDPMTSLNPLLTIERQMTEVLETHEGLPRRAARQRAARALGEVGLPDPETRLACHPHELSGGMRQRVVIAMALLCRPAVVLADEPTTALDVTIQAQVLELLAELQRSAGTALVLITHDLGIVAGRSDRVAVLYAGRLVEIAPTAALFARPMHAYTLGLLRSVPKLTGAASTPLESIDGQPPDPLDLPSGCAFAPRCRFTLAACRDARPPLNVALELNDDCQERRPRRTACLEVARVLADWQARK